MMIRWQPFERMDNLRRQIDEIFNDMAGQSQVETVWWPTVELIDTPDNFQLRVALPGISRDHINIEATRNAVSISGERSYPPQDDRATYLRSEFAYGKFQRLVNLPTEIDADRIQANYADGLLTLTLPKAEHARRHIVKVQVSELAGSGEQKALDVASEEVTQE
ncbi:MAG TPA: Hsp20/alpha crystallin family protein [Oscillatoriales cyanobacterium M59_W2019_021]|nr:Hsp20/alpha crystallin family protein [Oscillatoriales cyanobacterium M59_W2019_021]